ncbi:MAG: MATE family efflux transporter [Elusimicrobiota bacterium]|jgi:putative MATE family efflux protein|nr:MATE family efflux transporter [Elusimicrobiota bacterium]
MPQDNTTITAVKAAKNPFKASTISELLIKFSAPAIAGMFVNAFYNIVSRIYIGNEVGALGIAGISINFPLGIIFMAFSVLIGVGANALFSIRLGEKREDQAELILGNAFSALVLFSAVLAVLCITFLEPILTFFGATPEIIPYARQYAVSTMPGYFFFGISLGMNNFIRSSGKPKTAMATQFIGALINIIFAPLFIFKFKLGMTGAGMAVTFGQIVSFVWIMIFFLSKRAQYRLRLKNLSMQFNIIKESMLVGIAQFFFQVSSGLINIILNHALVKYGGNLAISAMGIVIAVNTIFVMPIIGISQGAQPLIGYNHGARKYKTSIQTLKMAIRWGLGMAMVGLLIMQIFARPIVSIFNSSDPALIDMATYALRIFNIVMPCVVLPILATSFFQAINNPLTAAILSLSRQILLLIPMVLILPLFFGLNGVFFAPPVADLLSAIFAVYLLKKHFAKHKQNFFFKSKK